MSKKVYVLYSCDFQRNYSSMNLGSLIGVLSGDENSEKLLRSYISRDHNLDVKEAYQKFQENILVAVIEGLIPYYYIEVQKLDELN